MRTRWVSEMDKTGNFENNDSFLRHVLRKYLFPTVFSIIGTSVIGFANSLIAGRMLGRDALTAMNIVSSFTFLFSMLGCIISIGASACASVAIGREDRDAVGMYTGFALIASIVAPVLCSVPLVLFFKGFMTFIGADESLYVIAADYGRLMLVFGILTTFMYFPFNFLRLDGRGYTASLVFGGMALLDIVLVLSFLKLGYGLFGIGLAVVISTAAADISGFLLLVCHKESNVPIGRIKAGELGEAIRMVWDRGSSAGLNNLCNMGRTMVLNAVVLHNFGADGAGVFAVACSVLNFTAASVSGFGQAISPLAGVFYGEKDVTSLKTLVNVALRYAMASHAVLFLLALPFSKPLVMLFGVDSEPMLSSASAAVVWVVSSLIPASVANIFIYYYSVLKKTALSCGITFFRAFLFVVAVSEMLIKLGLGQYMYASFLMSELLTLAALFLIAGFGEKGKGRDILMLGDGNNEKYVSFSVENNVQGAVNAAEKMGVFCEGIDIDQKLKLLLPMALEDLLVIVNEHCFQNEGKEYIDVRLFFDDDGVLMRIRCSGKRFDPVSWYKKKRKEMSSEELFLDESLGMQVITEQAKSVAYQSTFGVNNLIVVI